MDSQALVMDIRKTLTDFMNSVCKINMAMLIKDTDSAKYTFVLSSGLLDLLTPYDGTKMVAEYFYKNLSKEAFALISRINLISTRDPSVQIIMRTIKTSNSIVNISDSEISGRLFNVILNDAILLESHMPENDNKKDNKK